MPNAAMAPAPTNIYALTEWNSTGFSDATGKSTVSGTISSGESTLVLMCFGQSIAASSAPTAYTPSNAKVHQLNIYDGLTYQAADPMMGLSGKAGGGFGGSYLSRLGDKIIGDGKKSRVILVPISIGGTTINEWATGNLAHRLDVALLHLRAQQWIGNPDASLKVMLDIGQTDGANGTTQSAWLASFAKAVNRINKLGIGSPPIYVAQSTYQLSAANSTIRAAQAAVVDNVQVFAGPDLDTLTGADRQADGTHLSDAGADAAATLWRPIVAP